MNGELIQILVGVLIALLSGGLVGLFMLRPNIRKTKAEIAHTEAETADTWINALGKLRDRVSKLETERDELWKSIRDLHQERQRLTDKIEQQRDVLEQQKILLDKQEAHTAGLETRLARYEEGVLILIKQIRRVGHTPDWEPEGA